MIFSLDVRRARKGDCLLLHFGSSTEPGLVLIDGGPASVFKPHLEPRLDRIRAKRKNLGADDPLPVDLLMVSHVDDDHIRGILDLTKEEIERLDAQQPLKLNVLNFWHNSFNEIIGDEPKELTAAFTSHFGAAAANGGGMSDDAIGKVEGESGEEIEVVQSGLRVLASIEQGFRLRLDAKKLDYPLNSDFGGKLILAKKKGKKVKMSDDLTLTVVGPMQPELVALHKKHQDWLKELKAKGMSPPSALAAFVDPSVTNLSSIVVFAEAGGKTMLLTGDARGDKILKGLELVGLLAPGKTMEVDILKVPHHGSDNNLAPEFFRRIVADHYVFSGNGEHGNPERESLEMLFGERGKAPFTIHLTYPLKDIDVERKKDWEKEQQKEKDKKKTKPTTVVRPNWDPKTNGLLAFFKDKKLAKGQKLEIVDAKKPHVIDLLDAVGF